MKTRGTTSCNDTRRRLSMIYPLAFLTHRVPSGLDSAAITCISNLILACKTFGV